MFSKEIVALTNFAAEANIRPTLAGVHVKGNVFTATDSHKLIEVTIIAPLDVADFPTSSTGFNKAKVEDLDFMIPSDLLKDIQFPKKPNIDILNHAVLGNLEKDKTTGRVEMFGVMTNDLNREKIIMSKTLPGNFPDYESFFPKNIVATERIDIDLMLETLRTYKTLGYGAIDIELSNSMKPIVIRGAGNHKSNNPIRYKTRSIIMPLKK